MYIFFNNIKIDLEIRWPLAKRRSDSGPSQFSTGDMYLRFGSCSSILEKNFMDIFFLESHKSGPLVDMIWELSFRDHNINSKNYQKKKKKKKKS
jgi:hypothetical protein